MLVLSVSQGNVECFLPIFFVPSAAFNFLKLISGVPSQYISFKISQSVNLQRYFSGVVFPCILATEYPLLVRLLLATLSRCVQTWTSHLLSIGPATYSSHRLS